jgi:hypothetical protein
MHIPRSWIRLKGEGRTPDERSFPVVVWGSGPDEATAEREAAGRLDRLLDRIRRGDPFPDRYAYGSRPVREEILETFDGDARDEPRAVLTRNRYGATVLNTARLLFLDVDVAPTSPARWLGRLFSRRVASHDDESLGKLREALRRYGRATFRVYRTAAGYRAIAIDREFDPSGNEAQELMRTTGTDPAFARLCAVQKSFRARLTPKPWRCGCAMPPGQHPRIDPTLRERFAAWIDAYERGSRGYATCRHVETVGSARARRETEALVELHDRLTRCGETLPLA